MRLRQLRQLIQETAATAPDPADPTNLAPSPNTADSSTPSLTPLLPPPTVRTGIAALSSSPATISKPRLHCQPSQEGEGMYLLDSPGLVEEKEVGPDIPQGLADEDLSAMRDSETDPKPLQATQMDSE